MRLPVLIDDIDAAGRLIRNFTLQIGDVALLSWLYEQAQRCLQLHLAQIDFYFITLVYKEAVLIDINYPFITPAFCAGCFDDTMTWTEYSMV